jgi:hypothetical protein
LYCNTEPRKMRRSDCSGLNSLFLAAAIVFAFLLHGFMFLSLRCGTWSR